jgi:hypothetical protein
LAQDAAERSKAQLAAVVCVERFVNADDATAQLAALKDTSRWKQESFVEDGKWAMLPGVEEPVDGAADLCAEQLADMVLPVADMADTIANNESSVQ